ncbi:uncharacterized protein LOC124885798 [Capsicum annuum]|uniref:uncharacterized protein LOC124885798 n=1 Tax=Capsicum annuum TaxID=4072 RepID=UPI001FB1988C|nr:uncharacterized protein LOC124885798 [Capsicum annuum]
MQAVVERLRQLEGNKRMKCLNCEDLCIHPDLELSEGYKPPKFELYNGTGDPKAHLRVYCEKLVGIGKNEKIRMKFGYNIDNAPSWAYMKAMRKKLNESFCEYAMRWRAKAVRARPSVEEQQIKKYFVKAQEPQYLDKLLTVTDKSFSKNIRIGEMFEDYLKNGSIIRLSAPSQLIDTKVIQLKDPQPKVTNNPLPAHEVNMLDADDDVDLEHSIWVIEKKNSTPISIQKQTPFEVEQKVVIHGENGHPIYTIERKEDLDREMFHTLQLVGSIEGGLHNDALFVSLQYEGRVISRVLIDPGSGKPLNTLSYMSWLGYEEDKGLDARLQGIVDPIEFEEKEYTCGLGYGINAKASKGGNIFDSALLLYQIFHSAGFLEDSENEAEEIIKMLKGLFMTEDTILTPEGQDEIETMKVDMILKEETWKDTSKKMMKGLGAKLQEIVEPIQPQFKMDTYSLGYNQITFKTVESEIVTSNETTQHNISEVENTEEVEIPQEFVSKVEDFEDKPKANLTESEIVNIGSSEDTKETCKLKKYKPDLSLKIKEKISKQIEAGILRVTKYPTWLANDVPIHKKDGKVRVCVYYRGLNKASPKNDFPLPNIHILIDNCAKHEIPSFIDCFAGYHQIKMHEDDVEKMDFITPWGVYYYKFMSFGLKNAGATYMRAMTALFYDMIHKEIEVYVDYVIIKLKKGTSHLTDLKKFFDRLRKYNLKLNPAKCVFGVPAGRLLGFIVSRRGIELDPAKIKAIQDLTLPKIKKEVMSLLGHLNYINRFIAQSAVICEPIFKLLKKDVAVEWTTECQQLFDRIKDYLLNPPILVPPEPGRPLLLYLFVIRQCFRMYFRAA